LSRLFSRLNIVLSDVLRTECAVEPRGHEAGC